MGEHKTEEIRETKHGSLTPPAAGQMDGGAAG